MKSVQRRGLEPTGEISSPGFAVVDVMYLCRDRWWPVWFIPLILYWRAGHYDLKPAVLLVIGIGLDGYFDAMLVPNCRGIRPEGIGDGWTCLY